MNILKEDSLHEECGVFGIYESEGVEVSRSIYYGLMALQHRGQESAGMAVTDVLGPKGNIASHKAMGLVNEVFHKETLEELKGNIGIGHVRYSTTGGSVVENAQPMVLSYLKGTLALAHNGNITNSDELRTELQQNGAIFRGSTDSEVIACYIARERTTSKTVEEAVLRTARKLKGGYALLVMSPKKLIAVRDPLGLKPLCIGKRNDAYILASESCALKSVDAEYIRDVEPGEMLVITAKGIGADESKPVIKKETEDDDFATVKKPEFHSDMSLSQKQRAHCIFEYIYFARLDSTMDGIDVYDSRIKAGKALAQRYPVEADIVSGVPDSGLAAAAGYAEGSGIPFKLIFQKNSYVGRSFIKPTQEERESAVHIKLSVLSNVVKGKRIVLIDDSIVRGTTMANLVQMLRKAGALEVHVRISSPPFLYPCYYGTDVPDNSQLIASSHSVKEICKQIGADSLGYMKLEDLSRMTGDLPLCKACFDNNYPV